jgi:hypothetical protein
MIVDLTDRELAFLNAALNNWQIDELNEELSGFFYQAGGSGEPPGEDDFVGLIIKLTTKAKPVAISTLWTAICDHPDYAGGSVWSREDVAGALYHNEEDDSYEHVTPEELDSVSESQMRQARNTTESWLGADGGYSWVDAINDLVDL